jgi:hypothetical protein
MATYGLGAVPGRVPFTGYTNTMGAGAANAEATSGYVAFNGVQQGDDRIAKMLRNGGATAGVTQLLYMLLGAAAGGTAAKTKKQVQGVVGGFGGAAPIETINLINRATTPADLVAFQALLNRSVFPASYPADVSGNGGGGKQQVGVSGAY